jgi:hypothetical protein
VTTAGHTFLSWVRTGAIGQLGAQPGGLDAVLPAAPTLPVRLELSGADTTSFDARLAAPVEVGSLDRAQVIRTDPAPDALLVEPNYLAMIEFDRPDVPWMLTPTAPADDGSRRGLRPWLCLVAVPQDAPGVRFDPPTRSRPLGELTTPAGQLPDPETGWLWAHAQVLTTGVAGESVPDLLATAPDRTLSRLICPRRLTANTNWLACVVPTWTTAPGTSPTLRPAWSVGSPSALVELPVYYSWRFSTGPVGDGEQLARRIIGLGKDGPGGVRDLDIDKVARDLLGVAAGTGPWVIDFEGVLVGGAVVPGSWPGGPGIDIDETAFRDALAERLRPAAGQLTPPVYGQQLATLTGPADVLTGPLWLRTLNLDPRYRVAAAMGTRVVQRHQEALMVSAWAQTAQLREANRLMRQAQLAMAIGERIYATRFGASTDGAPLDDARLLQVTSAVHADIPDIPAGLGVAAGSVGAELAANPGVRDAVRVPFRRIARPTGPIARRLRAGGLAAPIDRLGAAPDAPGKLRPAPQLRAVGGTLDIARLSGGAETFAALTPARVRTRVFPWESPGAPQPLAPQDNYLMPYGFLADLIVSTRTPPYQYRTPIRSSAALAQSLDTDAIPEGLWRPQQIPPASAIGLGSGLDVASVYVDFGGRTGTITLFIGSNFAYVTWYDFSYSWEPGFPLDGAFSRGLGGPLVGGLRGNGAPPSVAVAAGDLGRVGEANVLFLIESMLIIGFGLREDGSFRTRVTIQLSNLPSGPLRATAAGDRLFVVGGTTLCSYRIDVLENAFTGEIIASVAEPQLVDLRPLPPDDVRGTAIAAADFGGMTAADLLVFYTAGPDGALRAGYRLVSDVGYLDREEWGPDLPAPFPVAGPEIGVLLGAMSGASAERRRQRLEAFRAAAGRTQTRQQRIVAVTAPPAAAPDVDVAARARAVRQAIDPIRTVTDKALARIRLPSPLDPGSGGDLLRPLAITPRFPYPTVELLRESFPDRFLPGASAMPDDRAAGLVTNRAVIESFLVGMNHEMAREFTFRGLPARPGTPFAHFWDTRRPDITPIEGWDRTSDLGTHPPPGQVTNAVVLVVRAELLRRSPHLLIYAMPARPSGPGNRRPDLHAPELPGYGGRIGPDVVYFGFDNLTPAQAIGTSAGQDGWYFVFQEHPTAPRFGLDEGGAGGVPATWSNVNWSQARSVPAGAPAETEFVGVAPDSALATLGGVPDRPGSAQSHRWAASAADMAHILLQRPIQVAIHAQRLLEAPPG